MTLEEFKLLHLSKGGAFFSTEPMKLTRCRVVRWYGDTGIFVTGETHNGDRRYTLRHADFNTGEIKLLGPYHKAASPRFALLQLRDGRDRTL